MSSDKNLHDGGVIGPAPFPESESEVPVDEEVSDGRDIAEEIAASELSRDEVRRILYAILFMSDKPVSIGRLAQVFDDMDPDVLGMIMLELKENINRNGDLPYQLVEVGGGYQLLTRPEFSRHIRKFFQLRKSNRLSKSLLETLAVIAYKQPVTRAEVEAIRGVSVSYAFDQLLEKKLIRVAGVSDLPGRPKLYRTTEEFLVTFGLNSLKDLPSLDEMKLYES
ncbi:MAG TPA: SMC-Scp complex subunit ScpB [Candidatus Hydrogenedentes bacterium]|nr:SMC-Scp complex subunit ScpB [Candidatus Hydrogenedentota bacterium]